MQISMNVTNPTPRLTQICLQGDHLKVLISQMGLTIKKFKSGRETLSLYPKLGTYHAGPIGLASHKRVFSGAYSNSTSSETSSGNKLLDRGACQNCGFKLWLGLPLCVAPFTERIIGFTIFISSFGAICGGSSHYLREFSTLG